MTTVLLVDGPAAGSLVTVPDGAWHYVVQVAEPVAWLETVEDSTAFLPDMRTEVYNFHRLLILGEYILVGSVGTGEPDSHETLKFILSDKAKGAIQPWPAAT